MAFDYNDTLGCFSTANVIKPGEDSNYGRFIKATAERLAGTSFFRRVFMAQEPIAETGVDYPYATVFPDGLPETEHTNISNMKSYNVLVLIATLDDNPFRGVMRICSIREVAESVCRSKVKVPLRDGDFHENTLIDSTPYIITEAESGTFLNVTGFRVKYDATEPRRIE